MSALRTGRGSLQTWKINPGGDPPRRGSSPMPSWTSPATSARPGAWPWRCSPIAAALALATTSRARSWGSLHAMLAVAASPARRAPWTACTCYYVPVRFSVEVMEIPYDSNSNIYEADRERCSPVRAGFDSRFCSHADGADPVSGPVPSTLPSVHGPYLSPYRDRRRDDRRAFRQLCFMALLPEFRRAVPSLADARFSRLHGDLRAPWLLHAPSASQFMVVHPLWPRVPAGDGDMPVYRHPGLWQTRPPIGGARSQRRLVGLAWCLHRDRRGRGLAGSFSDRQRSTGQAVVRGRRHVPVGTVRSRHVGPLDRRAPDAVLFHRYLVFFTVLPCLHPQ